PICTSAPGYGSRSWVAPPSCRRAYHELNGPVVGRPLESGQGLGRCRMSCPPAASCSARSATWTRYERRSSLRMGRCGWADGSAGGSERSRSVCGDEEVEDE